MRLKSVLTTIAVTGALVGGGAALASAATSTTTTSSAPTTTTSHQAPRKGDYGPRQGTGAPRGPRPGGTHHCPNGATAGSASQAPGPSL